VLKVVLTSGLLLTLGDPIGVKTVSSESSKETVTSILWLSPVWPNSDSNDNLLNKSFHSFLLYSITFLTNINYNYIIIMDVSASHPLRFCLPLKKPVDPLANYIKTSKYYLLTFFPVCLFS
jgi:hypothetical protein